jgi:hypothetical protein
MTYHVGQEVKIINNTWGGTWGKGEIVWVKAVILPGKVFLTKDLGKQHYQSYALNDIRPLGYDNEEEVT